jgi:uncharacterized Zn finger protein (UPF0148 family)
MEEENKQEECPRCGVALIEGICPRCGMEPAMEKEKQEDEDDYYDRRERR